MITIEKNIPIPGQEIPFANMEKGDSFFLKTRRNGRGKFANQIRTQASNFSRSRKSKGKFQFLVRSVEGGVRCWRIK